jgi:hypothetical protein
MLMVIDTSNNIVFDTVSVGDHRPVGIAMNRDGTTLYVTTRDDNYETNPSSGATVKAISVPPPQTSTYASESVVAPSQWWSCSSPPGVSSSPPPTSSSAPPAVSSEPREKPNQAGTVAGIPVLPGSSGIEPIDLGAGLWETFRMATFSQFRPSYLVGTLLASALSFSELNDNIFTAPPRLDTFSLWISTEMVRPIPASMVNVVATGVIALSLIPVFISQRLRRNNK